MTLLAREIQSDLAASHVHAQVRSPEPYVLLLEVESGTEQVERDAAVAIVWRHLHEEHGHA